MSIDHRLHLKRVHAMEKQALFDLIDLYFEEVVNQNTQQGKDLRRQFDALHPADMSDFFEELPEERSKELFLSLQLSQRVALFEVFSSARQVLYLSFLDEDALRDLLTNLPVDTLTDFFDELSDEDLKRYLKLLQEKER
jgi:Mg/Co/Ni transporter MgtE